MSERPHSWGTNAERLLRWALKGHVLHQDHWYSGGPDGGPPIKALRSRVPDLERLGYGFHHTTRPDGTREYRLAYIPERPGTRAPEPKLRADDVDEPPQLFPPPASAPVPPLNAALTDYVEDDAA